MINSINPLYNLQRFTFFDAQKEKVVSSDPVDLLNNLEDSASTGGVSDSGKVIQALEKSLQTQGLSLQGLDAEDFTPEKVADNILASVRKAYGEFQHTDSELSEDDVFSRISAGIEQGFAEAKEMLEGLGALQGKVAEDIEATYGLTMDGLQKLQSGETDASSETRFLGMSRSMNRSAHIEVETQDGDRVRISFNQSMSKSHRVLQSENEEGMFMVSQRSASRSMDFSISVEGELDKDEQKAIHQVMKKMRKVSHEFFQGDNLAAFKHASKLGYNSEQIAGFSMDLNMQKSVQAVARYQQTQHPESEVDSGLLGRAGDFLQQAIAVIADARAALELLAEPQSDFNSIFNQLGMLESHPQADDQQNADAQGMFSDMVSVLEKQAFDPAA